MSELHHPESTSTRHASSRRGLAHGETLVVLLAGAVLTASSFVFVPSALRAMAAPDLPADVPPKSPERLNSFEAIKALLSSCQEVVATHESADTGVTEVVLWHSDIDLDSALDPSELLVLTHSRFLGQISASSVDWQPSPDDDSFERLTRPIGRSAATSADFPSRWRERSDIAVATVAVGIDGFGLDDLSGKFGQDAFRVSLLWSTDVSDAIEDGPSSFVFTPGADP